MPFGCAIENDVYLFISSSKFYEPSNACAACRLFSIINRFFMVFVFHFVRWIHFLASFAFSFVLFFASFALKIWNYFEVLLKEEILFFSWLLLHFRIFSGFRFYYYFFSCFPTNSLYRRRRRHHCRPSALHFGASYMRIINDICICSVCNWTCEHFLICLPSLWWLCVAVEMLSLLVR